jgi:hypothetical protein
LLPLTDYFFEIGIASGDKALTYQEIESWSRQSGTPTTPFVVQAMRAMSSAYLGMMIEAEKESCPDPTKPAPVGRRKPDEKPEKPSAPPLRTLSSRKR